MRRLWTSDNTHIHATRTELTFATYQMWVDWLKACFAAQIYDELANLLDEWKASR